MHSPHQNIVDGPVQLSTTLVVAEQITRRRASPKLPAIQVLRGLAAALVVFHHFAGVTAGYNKQHSWLVSSRLSDLGAAGVDIFFVISGFIMFYTTTQNRGGGREASSFLLKRAFRIYPLYWFWTGVLLLLSLSKLFGFHAHNVSFYVLSFLLVPTFNGHTFHPFLDQGWTLSFEMMFYCVFALCVWTNTRRQILPFMSAMFVGLFLVGQFLPSGNGLKYLFSNTLIIEFLLGVAVAKIYMKTSRPTADRLKPVWLPFAFCILGFSLLASTALFHPANPGGLVDSPWRFLFWGIPSALIVAGFASGRQSLTHPVLVYIGDASYTTYLVHVFFLGAFHLVLNRVGALRSLPIDIEILAAVIVTILLTLPAYQWIERPLTSVLSPMRPPSHSPVVAV